MKDSVIIESGNSRYLKSVADFKTLYPTYDDFAAALVAGTLPVDFNGINTAGFQQVGDVLGKNTLLKDATAALFGLDATAVPNDVFSLLSRFHSNLGNEYLWYRYKTTYKDNFTIENKSNIEVGRTTVTKTYYCSSSVEIDDNNNAVLKNPNTITISSLSDCYSLNGKYYTEYGPSIPSTNYGYLAYISPNASFTKSDVYFYCSSVGICTNWFKEVINVGEYVNSQDPNTYPPATTDGYSYHALGRLGAKTQIEAGSYKGTGVYGKTLYFNAAPKMVIILNTYSSSLTLSPGIFTTKTRLCVSHTLNGGNYAEAVALTWSENNTKVVISGTLFNDSSSEYDYFVFY